MLLFVVVVIDAVVVVVVVVGVVVVVVVVAGYDADSLFGDGSCLLFSGIEFGCLRDGRLAPWTSAVACLFCSPRLRYQRTRATQLLLRRRHQRLLQRRH